MAINYRRLWKLLIDKNMKKCDLQEKAGLSSSTIAKLGKNEAVMSDVLDRICLALDCRIEEIMEVEHGKTLPPVQSKFQTEKKYTIASLFAGCGSLDLLKTQQNNKEEYIR